MRDEIEKKNLKKIEIGDKEMRDDLTITEIKSSRPHDRTSMWSICMCVFRNKKKQANIESYDQRIQ